MKLTSVNVTKVFYECLFHDGEKVENFELGEGVTLKVGFHPERLLQNESNISDMLDCLPDEFKKNSGGGHSFLNICFDNTGEQWTGTHQTVDQLVALGIASGKLSFVLPREMWKILPGGMPYLVIE